MMGGGGQTDRARVAREGTDTAKHYTTTTQPPARTGGGGGRGSHVRVTWRLAVSYHTRTLAHMRGWTRRHSLSRAEAQGAFRHRSVKDKQCGTPAVRCGRSPAGSSSRWHVACTAAAAPPTSPPRECMREGRVGLARGCSSVQATDEKSLYPPSESMLQRMPASQSAQPSPGSR